MTLWSVTRQALLSMGFPRQEYCSGLPFLSPRDLPNPGIKPASPALQVDSLPLNCLETLNFSRKCQTGLSLVIQELRLYASNSGGQGLIPGQGTRSHMPQLKILHAAAKTQHSQSKYGHTIWHKEDFPCGPVAKTPCSNAGGLGSVPG